MNFPCANAPFTVSPVPWASTCCVLPYPGTRPYMTFLFVSSQVCTQASFRPHLTVTPLPSASNLCYATLHSTGTLTGDLNPISSRPCRAYTKKSSRPRSSAADFNVPGDCVAGNRGADYVQHLVPALCAGTRCWTGHRAPQHASFACLHATRRRSAPRLAQRTRITYARQKHGSAFR